MWTAWRSWSRTITLLGIQATKRVREKSTMGPKRQSPKPWRLSLITGRSGSLEDRTKIQRSPLEQMLGSALDRSQANARSESLNEEGTTSSSVMRSTRLVGTRFPIQRPDRKQADRHSILPINFFSVCFFILLHSFSL
jgi:hypothetical protein